MDNLLCLRPVVLFPEDSVCSSYRLSSEKVSVNDLDGKKKKKKSFFNFRKKKDKTSS